MHTNGDITIYNKVYDETSRQDRYVRKVIKDVFVEERLGSNRLVSGNQSADKLLVMVPTWHLNEFVGAKDYDGSVNTFTFKIGDRIVRGVCEIEITSNPTELDKQVMAYTVTSVDLRDFGSYKMQHLEVGAN